jgi:type I restriction enzyme S subunit
MSFPRYPKYKYSGVEWLGKVPEHWQVLPLKKIVDIPITDGPHETPQFVDEGIPFVSAEAVSSGRIDFSKIRAFISEEDSARYSLKYSPKLYDIYMVKSGATTGITAIVEDRIDFNIWSPLAVIRCGREAAPYFVLNYMRSRNYLEAVTLNWSFGTQQNIGMGVIENLSCTLPPLEEQTQIAAFLNHETVKIDKLVREQQRLIELLKEKRSAVISHAVTKGLNSHARMKPSGVEWLGEVPQHWEVLPLKRIVSTPITDGPHETPLFCDEGVPFVSAEAVSSGSIDFSKVRACISVEDNARYSLKYAPNLHDIYMVKSGATTGVTAIVEDRTDFNIWSPLAAIRCSSCSVPHFVLNFMRSRHFLEAVTLYWSFGTQQNIGMGVIENLACTVPPLDEQMMIVIFLKSEIAKLDTLTVEAQRAIDLLQERRIAMISATVTGQIDVRGFADKECV